MRSMFIAPCVVLALLAPVSFADPVEALRDAEDIHVDLKQAFVTATGAVSTSQAISDEDAPPACVEKAAGSLDIVLDLGSLGAPVPVQVLFVGEKLSPTRVRWTTDTMIDICVPVEIDGSTIDIRFRRVQGMLTFDTAFDDAFTDACGVSRDVRLDDFGGDSQNFIDVEAYAFCIVSGFTRVDIKLRDIDALGYAGAATTACPGDANGDGIVDFADLSVVLTQFGQMGPDLEGDLDGNGVVDFADLSLVLTNWGLTC